MTEERLALLEDLTKAGKGVWGTALDTIDLIAEVRRCHARIAELEKVTEVQIEDLEKAIEGLVSTASSSREFTCGPVHELPMPISQWPSDEDIQKILDRVHREGIPL